MNHTIKTGLIALATIFAIAANAQETSSKKATFQLRGGLNISNLTATVDSKYDNATAKVGFNVGGILDCPLGNRFYLQTGLMLTSKGAKVKDIHTEAGNLTANMNAMYVQVPLYFAYKFQVSNNSNMIGIHLGPYFAYGIAGKTTFTQNSPFNSDDTFRDNGLWNKPDVGLGMELSFEMERVVFILGSEAGIAKLWNRAHLTEDVHVRNNNNYISVGFKF